MKFSLTGETTYAIIKTTDGYKISNCYGFLMESEQMRELGAGLIRYAKKHESEIREFNEKRQLEFDAEIAGLARLYGENIGVQDGRG